MTRMPTVYKDPLGLPFYWEDEVSGELRKAVHAYLDHAIDGKPFTAPQIELVRDYLQHWINAPCWDAPAFEAELKDLRETVRTLRTAESIHDWIHKALEIGMDPL
jgi:hypothetical protein